jgi:glucose-6-phosphate 1-epimerase
VELETRNMRNGPLAYEEALHTYLPIGDTNQAPVSGLEGTTYIDKTDGFKRKIVGNEMVRIAKETGQVHLSTKAACVVHDPAWNPALWLRSMALTGIERLAYIVRFAP